MLFSSGISIVSAESQTYMLEKDVNGVNGINLNDYFNENNVPFEKRDILLNKVENNELWDVYKPNASDQLPSDFFKFNYFDGERLVTTNNRINKIVPFGSWNHGDYIDGTRASRITNLYAPNASGFGVSGTPNLEIVREDEDPSKSRAALARSNWFSRFIIFMGVWNSRWRG